MRGASMTQQSTIGKCATTVSTDDDGWTNVVYHETTVVKFKNGKVILNSGGWRTATTKNRMNQVSNQFGLGFGVYQRNFQWWVTLGCGGIVPFSDGMMVQ